MSIDILTETFGKDLANEINKNYIMISKEEVKSNFKKSLDLIKAGYVDIVKDFKYKFSLKYLKPGCGLSYKEIFTNNQSVEADTDFYKLFKRQLCDKNILDILVMIKNYHPDYERFKSECSAYRLSHIGGFIDQLFEVNVFSNLLQNDIGEIYYKRKLEANNYYIK